MNFYTKHFLPKYLNLVMGGKDFIKYRQAVALEVSDTVLEIGFGSGLNLPYYSKVTKLYALDPSRELYDLAKDKLSQVSFTLEYLEASAESIPLPDSSIDGVVSTWSLCSIPQPEIALKEIFRVLKPGGKFSFIEHGESSTPLVFKMQNWLTPISKRIVGGCHLNRNIEKLILEAGFHIQKIDKFAEAGKPLSFMYKGVAVAKK